MTVSMKISQAIILSCIFVLAASQCQDKSTRAEFVSYVREFPVCRAGIDIDASTFQDEIQIINQVVRIDDTFNAGGLQREALAAYCSDVQSCKSAVSSCEPQLKDFVDSAGSALCQDGRLMTQVIDDALNTITNNLCELYGEPESVLPTGCHLDNEDSLVYPTYLASVERENKKDAASSRCLSRYAEAQGYCSSEVIAALATLTAASLPLETIGTSFTSHSSYQKPSLSTEHTTMSIRGFMHFYKDNERVESCIDLSSSNVLLWNTYIRVEGTGTELVPTTGRIFLSRVVIDFADDAGRVLDTYMTDSSLAKQTLLGESDSASEIRVEVINDNLIVISHDSISTKVAISSQGQALSIVISMPTSLIDLETFGVMAEGCTIHGGMDVDNFKAKSSSQCKSDCSSSDAEAGYYDECAYDCTNGMESYTVTYSNVRNELNLVAVVSDNSAGRPHLSALLSTALLFISLYVIL